MHRHTSVVVCVCVWGGLLLFRSEGPSGDSAAGWALSQTTHHCNQAVLRQSEVETSDTQSETRPTYSTDGMDISLTL